MRVGFLSLGVCLPKRIMANDEWSRYVDTSDEWIRERTGIERRRIAGPEEGTATLAEGAARAALDDASLQAADLEEIILATDTPEVYSPDTAAIVQHGLGCREIPTYDLAGSGCAGFLQGVDIACSRVRTGRRNVLVIGVEVISRIMSWQDRNTCVLFGDAAAAAIVGPVNGAGEVLAVVAGTEGGKAGILGKEIGGTRRPFGPEHVASGEYNRLIMNGREVYKEAVTRMTAAAREVLDRAGKRVEDVTLFVPHQANLRILHSVAEHLQLPLERVYINVQDYGNTGSASVPLALWEARAKGRVRPGDLVLLTAFGAGFHWAAALIQY
ncbi:MAG: ketoacyl-ACP synthase III [Planctomycetota bacterium]|nr:MAG: ketoacyl-ACP synthase III [Planctomycetota bacterium]